MANLREQTEADLAFTLEGDFSLPVVLIAPNGIEQSVTGQILYDHRVENPDTGEEIIINEPVVTLRTSSLSPVPLAGEPWFVRIPTTPSESAALGEFVLNSDRPPEGGGSIGFIRLYVTRVDQTDDDEF